MIRSLPPPLGRRLRGGLSRLPRPWCPALFALCLQSGVYRRYADRFMARACVDEVDVAAMLAPPAPGA